MNTKVKIVTLIIAGVMLCAGIGGTLAYFVSQDKIDNVITTGGIDIQIKEWQKDALTGELIPYPNEPIKVMPAQRVSKIVTAENIDEDAFVRASYTITFFDSEGNEMDIAPETLATLIEIATDNENWTLSEDGWYYYNTVLEKGEATLPLFEEVVFADFELGNDYQNSTVKVNVTVQAVQAENNGESAMEAIGWTED